VRSRHLADVADHLTGLDRTALHVVATRRHILDFTITDNPYPIMGDFDGVDAVVEEVGAAHHGAVRDGPNFGAYRGVEIAPGVFALSTVTGTAECTRALMVAFFGARWERK
jgi:hypothetical protein